MSDDDIDRAGALPPQPPPAPARREAAIAEAMRRFDGGVADALGVPPRRPIRTRPQLAGLVAASLVVVVGLPVAWLVLNRGAPHSMVTSDGAADEKVAPHSEPVPSAGSAAPGPIALVPPPPAAAVSPKSAAIAAPPREMQSTAMPAALGRVDAPALAAVPAQSAQLDLREERRADGATVSGNMAKAAPSRSPPAPPPPPPPPAAPAFMANSARPAMARDQNQEATIAQKSASRAQSAESENVIVTAQRARPRADSGASGALDRAIARRAKSAQDWLDKALARARAGDSAGALADLDRAVRLAPGSARVHFERARLLRARGDVQGAQAEFVRAAELDPAFGDPGE